MEDDKVALEGLHDDVDGGNLLKEDPVVDDARSVFGDDLFFEWKRQKNKT